MDEAMEKNNPQMIKGYVPHHILVEVQDTLFDSEGDVTYDDTQFDITPEQLDFMLSTETGWNVYYDRNNNTELKSNFLLLMEDEGLQILAQEDMGKVSEVA